MTLNETMNIAANLICENDIDIAGIDLHRCENKPAVFAHGMGYLRLNTKAGSGLYDVQIKLKECVFDKDTISVCSYLLFPKTGTDHIHVYNIDPIKKHITFSYKHLNEDNTAWLINDKKITVQYDNVKTGLYGENFFGMVDANKNPDDVAGYKRMPKSMKLTTGETTKT